MERLPVFYEPCKNQSGNIKIFEENNYKSFTKIIWNKCKRNIHFLPKTLVFFCLKVKWTDFFA